MVNRGHLAIARDHQGLGNHDTDAAGLASVADIETLQSRVVANVVWCFTIRHLPLEFALIHIEGGNHRVRRLHDRQTLDQQRIDKTAAAATWRCAATGRRYGTTGRTRSVGSFTGSGSSSELKRLVGAARDVVEVRL